MYKEINLLFFQESSGSLSENQVDPDKGKCGKRRCVAGYLSVTFCYKSKEHIILILEPRECSINVLVHQLHILYHVNNT